MPKQSIKTYSFLRTTSAVAKTPPPAGTPSIIEGEIPPRRCKKTSRHEKPAPAKNKSPD